MFVRRPLDVPWINTTRVATCRAVGTRGWHLTLGTDVVGDDTSRCVSTVGYAAGSRIRTFNHADITSEVVATIAAFPDDARSLQ